MGLWWWIPAVWDFGKPQSNPPCHHLQRMSESGKHSSWKQPSGVQQIQYQIDDRVSDGKIQITILNTETRCLVFSPLLTWMTTLIYLRICNISHNDEEGRVFWIFRGNFQLSISTPATQTIQIALRKGQKRDSIESDQRLLVDFNILQRYWSIISFYWYK